MTSAIPTLNILIADSDADTRALYRESLRATGCEFLDAVDGRDALVRALIDRPSLVITETRLPVVDGYRLCEVLRNDAATRSVPILVVTGETRKNELDRARESGADVVLMKPVTVERLLVEVKRLIKEGRIAQIPPPPRTPARRLSAARALARLQTANPPIAPRDLYCPACATALTYQHSYLGGVSQKYAEQWDWFECPRECGSFEYRVRTKKLRKLQDDWPPTTRRAVNDG